MRRKFKSFFGLSNEEIQNLWSEGLFIFDTSVLLNVYSYSEASRRDFFATLERVKDRLWMPFHVGSEFLSRRLRTVSRNAKSYVVAATEIKNLVAQLERPDGHPHISESALSAFNKSVQGFLSDIEQAGALAASVIDRDAILDKLVELFDGKVGEDYDDERRKKIFTQAQSRYAGRIPPGYLDKSKVKRSREEKQEESEQRAESDSASQLVEGNSSNVYGDVVIWMQILDKAQADGSSVVLITDELKPDWWRMHEDRFLGPRVELINEFRARTNGKDFHLYRASEFLSAARTYLRQTVQQSTIEQARSVEEREASEAEARRAMARHFRSISGLTDTVEYANRMKRIIESAIPFKLEPQKFANLMKEINAGAIPFNLERQTIANLMKEINAGAIPFNLERQKIANRRKAIIEVVATPRPPDASPNERSRPETRQAEESTLPAAEEKAP